jgi:predicted amidophosphoribosyltransferase
MKKKELCSECGAELQAGPARCPLCGADAADKSGHKNVDWERPTSVKSYQDDVRSLREELKRLRDEGAEAV